ncbi:hypothetical protein [Streptomyces flaveolus]|uniref:hypothetical protein n=1 Tax=Streptomyces flaveolus TaxID=67297 RepID=UPI003F53F4BB
MRARLTVVDNSCRRGIRANASKGPAATGEQQLLDAVVEAGEIRPGTQPYGLTRGIGSLCVGPDNDLRYDPRRPAALLLRGLRQPRPS